MAANSETKSLPVLIDADNTSAKHAQPTFEEIIKLGEASVRRIYGVSRDAAFRVGTKRSCRWRSCSTSSAATRGVRTPLTSRW